MLSSASTSMHLVQTCKFVPGFTNMYLVHPNAPLFTAMCIIILPAVLDVPVNEWERTRRPSITSSNCRASRGWSAKQNHGQGRLTLWFNNNIVVVVVVVVVVSLEEAINN